MAAQTVVTSAPAQQNTMAARPVDDDVTIWLEELKAVAADRATPPQHETGEWHFSAWGFLCPFTTCLQGCICPCITIGKTQHRLHHDPKLEGYKLFNTTCLTYMCCTCAFSMHPVLNIGQRGTIKRRWGLQGSFLGDCLRAFCCTCCDVIQQEKEVEYRLLRQGQGPVVADQPQIINEDMKMSVQDGKSV